jgi:hypothetical protein
MEPMLGASVYSLKEYWTAHPEKIDTAWIKMLIARTALAIDYMHKKGWGWHDGALKNIFIDTSTGLTKIGDFGLSKRIDDTVSSHRFYLVDWGDLGSDIVKPFIDLLSANPHLFNKFLALLEDAFAKLKNKSELRSEYTGELSNLDQLKKLTLFEGFDWDGALRGTTKSTFVLERIADYINFIYRNNKEIAEKILSGQANTLRASSFDGLTLDSSFLDAANKIRPEGSKEIKSAADYCEVMDPRLR